MDFRLVYHALKNYRLNCYKLGDIVVMDNLRADKVSGVAEAIT